MPEIETHHHPHIISVQPTDVSVMSVPAVCGSVSECAAERQRKREGANEYDVNVIGVNVAVQFVYSLG